jgi:hypothetical protein
MTGILVFAGAAAGALLRESVALPLALAGCISSLSALLGRRRLSIVTKK